MVNFGFTFEVKGDIVTFFRQGKKIKQIKGLAALKFLESAGKQPESEIQIQIAKLTGNYKRGNERFAQNHPKNKK